MNLTIYNTGFQEDIFEKWMETIFDSELKYLASDLIGFGIRFEEELSDAVDRALLICLTAQVSIKRNFKPVYIDMEGQLMCDWRLSSLGKKLVMLNANPANPFVAKLQLQLLK